MPETITPQTIIVKINHGIDLLRVKYLLCSALEGGSNYWINRIGYRFAEGLTITDFRRGGKFQHEDNYFHPAQIIPTVPGCALEIKADCDDAIYVFNLENIQKGLQLMAEGEKADIRHWNDFIEENDDADTADVFMQLALFGEVVYG